MMSMKLSIVLAQRLVICPKFLLPTKIDEVSIKIIQWNISYNSKIEKIIEYLKVHIEGQTIICLQDFDLADKPKGVYRITLTGKSASKTMVVVLK